MSAVGVVPLQVQEGQVYTVPESDEPEHHIQFSISMREVGGPRGEARHPGHRHRTQVQWYRVLRLLTLTQTTY